MNNYSPLIAKYGNICCAIRCNKVKLQIYKYLVKQNKNV